MHLFVISGNAEGLRAGELSHTVEHAHADHIVSSLRVDVSSLQATAREGLESVHHVLGEGAAVIAATLLPFPAAESSNCIDRVVAPCCTRHGHLPMKRAVARRDTGCRTACRNRGMTRF